MLINNLCPPALIYAVFTITQILIDLYNYDVDVVVSKLIALVIFTYLLNILCESGLTPISWIIVFVPFIFTTLITFIVLTNMGADLFSSFI